MTEEWLPYIGAKQVNEDQEREAADAARRAYFGAGRHGHPEFEKLAPDAQQTWRKVARAALAAQAAPAGALTDAQLLDLAADFRSSYQHAGTMFDEFDALGFARAVLAARQQESAAAPATGPLPRACDLLSSTIGTLMGHRQKIGYTDNSPIAKMVREAVDFLEPWPEQLPQAAAPATGAPTDAQLQAAWDEACDCTPQRPMWNRHIRFARAVLALASTQAEPSEVERDAARYRWLRDPHNHESASYVAVYGGRQLDAAIDALASAPTPKEAT